MHGVGRDELDMYSDEDIAALEEAQAISFDPEGRVYLESPGEEDSFISDAPEGDAPDANADITNEIFEAFLRCPTKCFLQREGMPPSGNVYAEWVRGEMQSYRVEGAKYLMKRLSPIGPIDGLLNRSDFILESWRGALNSRVRSQNLESRIDAIERLPSQTTGLPAQFVPIRFVRAYRPNNIDKLTLAFDAVVLSETIGQQVDFGIKAAVTSPVGKVMQPPFAFKQHGNAGMWVSELMPHLAKISFVEPSAAP